MNISFYPSYISLRLGPIRQMAALVCLMGVSGIEARTKRIKKEIIWPTVSYHADQEKVAIDARTLSKQETEALFDGNGRRFLGRKPIIPVEISIVNKSEAPIIITSITPSCSLIDRQSIIDRLNNRNYLKIALWALAGGVVGIVTGGIVAAVGAFAVVGSPFAAAATAQGTMFAGFFEALIIGTSGLVGACIALPVSSYVLAKSECDAQSTRNANVKERLSSKMINNEIVIKPGQTYTGYLFTNDYTSLKEHFSVTLA